MRNTKRRHLRCSGCAAVAAAADTSLLLHMSLSTVTPSLLLLLFESPSVSSLGDLSLSCLLYVSLLCCRLLLFSRSLSPLCPSLSVSFSCCILLLLLLLLLLTDVTRVPQRVALETSRILRGSVDPLRFDLINFIR